MSMGFQQDDEIVNTFILETKDHLDEIESGLLTLENNLNVMDDTLVHSMFRASHSIKAGANLLEYRNIERLAHEMENILDAIRGGRLQLSDSVVTMFLEAIDLIREMLRFIQVSDDMNIDHMAKKLKRFSEH